MADFVTISLQTRQGRDDLPVVDGLKRCEVPVLSSAAQIASGPDGSNFMRRRAAPTRNELNRDLFCPASLLGNQLIIGLSH